MRPRRNLLEGNVLVNYVETFWLIGEFAQCEYRDNYITHRDPGFVDAGKMDFRLKDDSVIYREIPGFRRIPFDEIGPRKASPVAPRGAQ
jgi:hypothetical protein